MYTIYCVLASFLKQSNNKASHVTFDYDVYHDANSE